MTTVSDLRFSEPTLKVKRAIHEVTDERFTITVKFHPNQAKALGKTLDSFEIHGFENAGKIAAWYHLNNMGVSELIVRYQGKKIFWGSFDHNHDSHSATKRFKLEVKMN